jgi:hypothetical protein
MNGGKRLSEKPGYSNHQCAPHTATEMNFGLREDDRNHQRAPHAATGMMEIENF